MLDLRDVLAAVPGAALVGEGAVRVSGVSTDTRRIGAGDLFVALHGERFDGHDFAAAARAAGAAAVLVERWPLAGCAPPALVAPDSLAALGALARHWRARFELPVVAITGSNGKTTVKDMVAAVLAAAFGEPHRLATRGNLNNEIGLPLTVLGLRAAHRAAVLELGMNRPGEIARLARIAQPTVALVNNAQREHQEFMKSVEAVALENGAVLAALATGGVAVFPGDDPHAPCWRELAGTRARIEFGQHPGAAVRAAPDAQPARFELALPDATIQVSLAIDGAHNVRNALAAAACAHAAGIGAQAIRAGLEAFRPAAGRLTRLRTRDGALLLDDTYNANPDSVRAAIDVLRGQSSAGARVLVLGDMGEVGDQGVPFHREVGDYARQHGVTHLLALGELAGQSVAAFGAGAEHFDAIEPLAARVCALAPAGSAVLVKGSRFMRMERVVAALIAAPSAASAPRAPDAAEAA